MVFKERATGRGIALHFKRRLNFARLIFALSDLWTTLEYTTQGRLTNRGAARRTLRRLISRESDDNPDVHAATFYLSGGEKKRTNFKVVLTRVFGAVVVSKTACVSFHPKVLDSIN